VIKRLAFQSVDAEDTLVDPSEGFSVNQPFKPFDPRRERTETPGVLINSSGTVSVIVSCPRPRREKPCHIELFSTIRRLDNSNLNS
jgi:hypothetical protein